ncbi:MAG: FHA domain-containing protein [Planctomycetota bacterium]|nr:FHA domain-containing protein [Planctomycetota bacterium]
MPILEIKSDNQSQPQRVRLEESTITLGRGSDNTIILRNKSVSRRHIEIEFDGTHAKLRDLNSTFGTIVNGEKTQFCILEDGDLIRIGPALIKFIDQDEQIADDDEIVSFEPVITAESSDAPEPDSPRVVELESSLHERDAELERLQEELQQLRQEASTHEQQEVRMEALSK